MLSLEAATEANPDVSSALLAAASTAPTSLGRPGLDIATQTKAERVALIMRRKETVQTIDDVDAWWGVVDNRTNQLSNRINQLPPRIFANAVSLRCESHHRLRAVATRGGNCGGDYRYYISGQKVSIIT